MVVYATVCGEHEGRKSTCWKAAAQLLGTVTPSTTEVESLAFSSGVRELMASTRFLRQNRLRIREHGQHHGMSTSITMGFVNWVQ
jgi:hypothetical protein